MSSEPTNLTDHHEPTVEGERGALVAVLLMVVLGVAGIFVVS
ncbi:hypothetical protein [Micromonospora sp. NPDC000207]